VQRALKGGKEVERLKAGGVERVATTL